MTILIFISSKQVTLILMWRQTIPKGVLSFRLVHEPPKSFVVYTGTPNPWKMSRRSFIVFFMREPRHYTLPSGESPVTSSPLSSCVWNVAFFVHWTGLWFFPLRDQVSLKYTAEADAGFLRSAGNRGRINLLTWDQTSSPLKMPAQGPERWCQSRGWRDHTHTGAGKMVQLTKRVLLKSEDPSLSLQQPCHSLGHGGTGLKAQQ